MELEVTTCTARIFVKSGMDPLFTLCKYLAGGAGRATLPLHSSFHNSLYYLDSLQPPCNVFVLAQFYPDH